MKQARPSALPSSLPPMALSRVMAAEYCNVSTTKFDEMVGDGRMPRPRAIDSRRIWLRTELDTALYALEEVGAPAPEEEWELSYEPISREEQTRTELTTWERILLTGLLKRNGPVDPTTIEGAGPASRKSLAARGFIKDDGHLIEITKAGAELARRKSGLMNRWTAAPPKQAPATRIDPTDRRAPEWHHFIDVHSPEELARPMGKREMSVMKQTVEGNEGQAETWDVRGAGPLTTGLLCAKKFIEPVSWEGKEFLRATPLGKKTYKEQASP